MESISEERRTGSADTNTNQGNSSDKSQDSAIRSSVEALSPSDDSKVFIECIDEETLGLAFYDEEVNIRDQTQSTGYVGTHKVTMTRVWKFDQDCIKVNTTTVVTLPLDKGFTKEVECFLDGHLGVVHEIKTEKLHDITTPFTYKHEIKKVDNNLSIAVTADHGEPDPPEPEPLLDDDGEPLPMKKVEKVEKTKTTNIPYPQANCFISDGSSILLQRMLVRDSHEDPLHTQANLIFLGLDSDGNLIQTRYDLLPERELTVGMKSFKLRGLGRKCLVPQPPPEKEKPFVLGPKVLPQPVPNPPLANMILTYCFPDGHIALRFETGSKLQFVCDRVPDIIERDEFIPTPRFTKQPLDWSKDEELREVFEDKKDELSRYYARYLRDHPAVESLLTDFVHFVLQRKPDNIYNAARDFFATYTDGRPLTGRHSAKGLKADCEIVNS